MSDPVTSATDVPPPRGHRITVPGTASGKLAELPAAHTRWVAGYFTAAAQILRTRPARSLDECLNRPSCHPTARTAVCCMLCALDIAVIRFLPADATVPHATEVFAAGVVAKELALDTIEANPAHGGEVFLLDHLATLIRTDALPTPA